MQSNQTHQNLAHLKSITKSNLSLLISALTWDSKPSCQKGEDTTRIEKGNYLEYRRPDYLSSIVKVVAVLSETRFWVEDDSGKFEASSSELFSISEMQQRILSELQKPGCLECTLEFEGLKILSLMIGRREGADQSYSQEERIRSRSRDKSKATFRVVSTENKTKHRQVTDIIDLSQSPVATDGFQQINTVQTVVQTLGFANTGATTRDDILAVGDDWSHKIEQHCETLSISKDSKFHSLLVHAAHAYAHSVHEASRGSQVELETSVLDFMLELFLSTPPRQNKEPKVLYLTREKTFSWCRQLLNLLVDGITCPQRKKVRESVLEERSKKPDYVVFTVCTGSHHYVCVMSKGESGLVEILTLDSLWNGEDLEKHSWGRILVSSTEKGNLLDELQMGDERLENMVGYDDLMQCLFAALAQTYWPEAVGSRRDVIQKFPLVPYQGSTLDCGVYSFYFVAAMLKDPAKFMSAFDPGYRLTVGEEHCGILRENFLEATEMVLNNAGSTSENFSKEVVRMHDWIDIYVEEQNDYALKQQNGNPYQTKIARDKLIRQGSFPCLQKLFDVFYHTQ